VLRFSPKGRRHHWLHRSHEVGVKPSDQGLGGPYGFRLRHLVVLPERTVTSLNVQIVRPDNEVCSPTSTEILLRMKACRGKWPGHGSFQVQVQVQVQVKVTLHFQEAGGERFERRLGSN
jgi:hypothetical protein